MSLGTLSLQIRSRHRPAVLLGAGASIGSGGRTGSSIADDMARALYGSGSDTEIRSRFKKEFGADVTFESVMNAVAGSEEVRRTMLRKFFDGMCPSEGYQYLALLLKAGYLYPVVLTCNIEPMLENAIREELLITGKYTVKTLIQEEVQTPLPEPQSNEVVIIKLHGDLERGGFRSTHDETIALNESAATLVAELLERRGLIAVGYRGRDTDVLTALQAAKNDDKRGLFWVAKGALETPVDDEITELIHRHNGNADANPIDMDFDAFFRTLGSPLKESIVRGKNSAEFKGAWDELAHLRSFGENRSQRLTKLECSAANLRDKTELEEAVALWELVSYEIDHTGETYRLRQAVELLESALSNYDGFIKRAELEHIEAALLSALLDLFLAGSPVPENRIQYLDGSIERCRHLVDRGAELSKLGRPRFKIALAEALKERAMITSDTTEHSALILEARALCTEAVALLAPEATDEARFLRGVALRHCAVTYELEADICQEHGDRNDLYAKWRQMCLDAIDTLEPLNEDAISGYAWLNAGASCIRLADEETIEKKKIARLDRGLEELDNARNRLHRVGDARGVGWAYVHTCVLHRRRLALLPSERARILPALERFANKAVASLRNVDDHLAVGLAWVELGIALSFEAANSATPTAALIRKSAGARALQTGIENLERTGYFRGAGDAFLALGRIKHSLWKMTGDKGHLHDGVESLTRGLIVTSAALGEDQALASVSSLLEEKLNSLL
jgi:hypothetical protein